MSLVILKPAYVVEQVTGFETVWVAGNPCESLPRLESIHAGKLCAMQLYRFLLFLDKLQEFK